MDVIPFMLEAWGYTDGHKWCHLMFNVEILEKSVAIKFCALQWNFVLWQLSHTKAGLEIVPKVQLYIVVTAISLKAIMMFLHFLICSQAIWWDAACINWLFASQNA